jgi:hypothetical protein
VQRILASHDRFGSNCDIAGCPRGVRYAPVRDRISSLPANLPT